MKTEIKLFMNNLIVLLLFIYYLNVLTTSFNILYIDSYKGNPENIKINFSELEKEYNIKFNQQEKYVFPEKRLIFLSGLILILILNQFYYINEKYLKKYIKKIKKN